MKKTTTYLETLRNGLVPVKFVGWVETYREGYYHVVIQVVRSRVGYRVGERLAVPPRHVVNKVGKGLVNVAVLPVRSADNTLKRAELSGAG